MNLLFSFEDYPWLLWVVIISAVLAVLLIVLICVVLAKKSQSAKNAKPAAKQTGAKPAAERQASAKPAPAKQAAAVREERPAQKPAPAPAKPAPKANETAAKPVQKPAPAPAKPAQKPAPAPAPADDKKPGPKTYHIAKRKEDGRWQVKAAGGSKAIKLFNTQAEAIDYAKVLADNQEARFVIHKEDGSFRRLSYGGKK